MDEKTSNTNIQVAIRIRPLIATEKRDKLKIQWATQDSNVIYPIDSMGQKYGEAYSFDHIFGVDKTNEEVFKDVVDDFVQSSMNGLNATIFAYGQTSSGKTYTMLGDKRNPGVMSLAIDKIFNMIETNTTRTYLIQVSYIEIYNEKINDLLEPENKDIKIRELHNATVILQNIKEEIITSREQMYDILKRGISNRHIGATKANERSSRSHTIFRIIIESQCSNGLDDNFGGVQVSNLNLVDLAGSERVAQTKATGKRLIEGGHINKSLSALGLVIKQLSEGQEFVNFRDSKLTRLLQDSLGGNSKTLIIATITLVSTEDTASTLAFAQRAKTVRNKPQVNEILSDADVNKRYAALNAQLQKELDEQVKINQKLQHSQEENAKEIMKLERQKEQLKAFQNGKKTPEGKIPKRRHTIIGLSARKQKFSGLPLEDFSTLDEEESDIVPPFTSLLSKRFSNCVSNLDTITEEDFETSNKNATMSTPENFLRMRITSLEQDYDELVTFTRNEESIFDETSRKADELEKQLEAAREKIRIMENKMIFEDDLEQKNKIKELELMSKITQYEEYLKERNEDNIALNEDVKYMHKQLVTLQNMLIVLSRSEESNAKRADNILEEYEKKFAALAEEKQTLVDEIKRLETVVASQNQEINNQNNTIHNWESDYLALKRERERETQTDIDKIQELRNSLISKDEEIKKLNKELANQKVCFSNEIDQLSQEIMRQKKLIGDYETSAEKHKDEVRQLTEQLTEKTAFYEKQNEINKTSCMKHGKEIDRLKLELVEREQDYIVLLKENEKLTHKNDDLVTKLDETKITAEVEQKKQIEKLEEEFRHVLQTEKETIKKRIKVIVDHFISEQKTLLLVRHSQNERDLFKTVLRDLKSNNVGLKNLLEVLRNGDCDLCDFSDSIIKCDTIFREYFKVEKDVLTEQIHELENSNKAYLDEIMSLRKFQQEQEYSKENICCPQCERMKSEVSRLTETKNHQEKLLADLSNKNVILKKENIDALKQFANLQIKMYKEQDKKSEVQYSEYVNFYKQHVRDQAQEIQKLKEKLDACKKSTNSDKHSVKIQCVLLQESEVDNQNYIAGLKYEIENLKGKLENQNKGQKDVSQMEVEVQCDIMDPGRYYLMKKACLVRKEENDKLKAQLSQLQRV